MTLDLDNFQSGDALIHFIDTTEQYVDLPSLLLQVSSKADSSWRIAQAYILWRIGDASALLVFLDSLPASFHSYVDYWVFRGLAYKNLPDVSGFLDRSKNSFLNAIKLDSCRPDIYYNLANLLHDSDYCSALRYYLKSLHLNSYQPHVWHNLGLLLADNLILFVRSVIKYLCFFRPPQPLFGVITVCPVGLHLYTAAESAFKLSIECDTNFHESYTNLGTLKVAQRQPESALKFFHNGLSIHPSASSSRFNLSLCYLLMGNYTDGWQLYEERFKTGLVPRECFPSNGPLIESFDEIFKLNKPLLIWAEQGIGDVIQFSRYLLYFLDLEIDFFFMPTIII